MENKGKLLVSTQAASSRKMAVAVCSVIMVIFGIFFVFNFRVFGEIGDDILDSSTIGNIVGIIMIAFFFLYPALCAIGFRSYCNIYENGVTGMTGLSISHPNAPMRKFDINYNEIINVTESGKTIFIHTQYATYEVLAMTNRVEAIKELKARIGRNK